MAGRHMVIGTLRVVLQIPSARSLKEKRQVVRRVIDRVRARFNVSIAEVADNDRWQTATLGVAVVSNSRPFANEVLDKVLRTVNDASTEAWVGDQEIEITSTSDSFGRGGHERTLAEAEGLVGPASDELDEDKEFGEIPSQEELEAAALPRGPSKR